MDTTLYVGLSHQMAMRRNMDILANNIANMNTTAFKKENLIFQTYLVDMKNTDTPAASTVAYVHDAGVARDFSEGEFTATGNPLDLALSGQNFFRVQMPDGSERYTRNGHFELSDNGDIVTSSGNPILDEAGHKIAITPKDGKIEVASDGTISTAARGVIGKLGIVTFKDLSKLEKAGDSLYSASTPAVPATKLKVMQGMTESSNVEPIVEMTNMMNFARRYEAVAKMLQDQQNLEAKADDKLAKVSG